MSQSDEDQESARLPTTTKFNLEPTDSEEEGVQFSLVADAMPKSSSDLHVDLHVNEFVVNTLVALSVAPFVNFVFFSDHLRWDDADQERDLIFDKIVERKASGFSDRDTLSDIYRDQEGLILFAPLGFSVDQISITGYRYEGGKKYVVTNLALAHEIQVTYAFYSPSLLGRL